MVPVVMMQAGVNPPKWAFKSCAERGRILDCARERIQAHARIRDKRKVY